MVQGNYSCHIVEVGVSKHFTNGNPQVTKVDQWHQNQKLELKIKLNRIKLEQHTRYVGALCQISRQGNT